MLQTLLEGAALVAAVAAMVFMYRQMMKSDPQTFWQRKRLQSEAARI